ncbi:MAG: rcc01693 family protein [Pseudomonadota bacterium]
MIDWPALIKLGLGPLRLTPQDFWALTPAEFLTAAGLNTVQKALGRDWFEALSRTFPDTETE